jgi:hypothetical protein
MIFVPIIAIILDVVAKVFSNMFYPTQTQIHLEIEANEKADKKRYEREFARGQHQQRN